MKRLILILFLLVYFNSIYAQKELDSIMILKVTDTSNLHNRIKWTLIEADFIVKDLPSRDTLTTYGREFLNNNFMRIRAVIINSNEVKFTGIWGSRQLDGLGYSVAPSEYKKVLYYRGSVEWKIMKKIAESIGGTITSSQ